MSTTFSNTIHWDALLADDDWITTTEHTASGSLRVFSEYPAAKAARSRRGSMTQVWLSGSTNTVTHPVRVRFTTHRGRRHDFVLHCRRAELGGGTDDPENHHRDDHGPAGAGQHRVGVHLRVARRRRRSSPRGRRR